MILKKEFLCGGGSRLQLYENDALIDAADFQVWVCPFGKLRANVVFTAAFALGLLHAPPLHWNFCGSFHLKIIVSHISFSRAINGFPRSSVILAARVSPVSFRVAIIGNW